jgi:hypothetical protein
MNRFKGILRWRHLRWIACAAVVPALWACNARKLAAPDGKPSQVVKNRFQQSVNRDLDLLFLIDDSNSMAPLQAKMRQRMPDFMNVLKGLPGGLPNVHVAVVSSSLGAGIFGNVTGCAPATSGNLGGEFQHKAACGLNDGETFIKSLPGPNGAPMVNFTGDITDVFSCIADLGQAGCGFEHQFESVRLALQKSTVPGDPNYGFLRDTAYLAILFLTNEDDCSVDQNSTLFDPNQQTVADPLGGLQSYRCNEFGHKCDQAFPHTAAGTPLKMENCRSAEDGKLVNAVDGPNSFAEFLKLIKPPEQLLLAAIQGPTEPYWVDSKSFMLGNGGTEMQPTIRHSCPIPFNGSQEYADPGVRIKQALDQFSGAVIESICANDFRDSMVKIAEVIGRALGAQCVPTNLATKMNGEPDCDVVQRSPSSTGVNVDTPVPFCQGGRSNAPCWEFAGGGTQCPGQQILNVCYDAGCTAGAKPTNKTDALVSCAIM